MSYSDVPFLYFYVSYEGFFRDLLRESEKAWGARRPKERKTEADYPLSTEPEVVGLDLTILRP